MAKPVNGGDDRQKEEPAGARIPGAEPGAPIISAEAVAQEVARFSRDAPSVDDLDQLVDGEPLVRIDALRAGYGQMEILHEVSLRVGKGQSLCLIGPNGAGKSTVLHSIFGFTQITGGSITVDGRDVTRPDSTRATG